MQNDCLNLEAIKCISSGANITFIVCIIVRQNNLLKQIHGFDHKA